MPPLCDHDVLPLPSTRSDFASATSGGLSLDKFARLKAVADVVLAVLMLLVTWPVILLLMALVKLTSRGPAFYTQVRVGLGGRDYVIYKLRTMAQDCERHSGPQWSQPDDPRVTPLGRILRRSHLDELPQLWNVLRGEMSLVGPRPERPVFVHRLEKAIPDYRERLTVRPGVTGLAQILLPADIDLEGVQRKVACDLCYIERMGPWLDMKILFGTMLKVLGVPRRAISWLLRLPGLVDQNVGGEPEGSPQIQTA